MLGVGGLGSGSGMEAGTSCGALLRELQVLVFALETRFFFAIFIPRAC